MSAPNQSEVSTERWIYGFRSVGFRYITQDERKAWQGRRRAAKMKCAAYGILAVLFGVAIFLGIAVATSHAFIGVPSSILALVLTGAMLSLASAQEKFVLLCQRIARIGKVERFERAELDDDVRTHFQSTVSVTDEEMPLDPFWLCDEKLISLLRRLNSGKEVHTFETLADETPLVSVEGNPVNKVYDQTRATISRTEIDPFLKL